MTAQFTEQEAAELMASYGIVRVEAIQYGYKDWRYSNPRDAVAQAERDTRIQFDNPR